jgi:hypothetical protein
MKTTSLKKSFATAIVASSGIYRFATPNDLKLPTGKGAALKRAWRKRTSQVVDLAKAVTRQMPFASPERVLIESRAKAEVVMAGHAGLADMLEFHDQHLENLRSEEGQKETRELFAAVRGGDQESKDLLAATVTETTGKLLMASAGWSGFFQQINLGDADQFVHQRRIGNETSVRVVGPDGKTFHQPASNNFSFTPVPLIEIGTDILEYPLFDVNAGDGVRENALSSVSLAADLMSKVDELTAAQIVVTSPDTILTANFTVTGDLQDRSYVTHSRVNAANLPAGNILVLLDNTATSLPRSGALYAIIDYVASFGSGAFSPEEDLRPEVLHVPAKHAASLLAEAGVTAVANSYADSLIKTGPFKIVFGGVEFTIVPDNTLDPDSPYIYVRFNRPVGIFLDKPTQARTIIDEGPAAQRMNKGTVNQTRAVGFVMPKHWSTNVLAVKYRD